MAIVTKEKLENADIDVDDLAAIVNGSTTVTTRLGGDKLSVDQALSQIIVGEVAVYSAAATYTNIEDWVEFSGVVYRPLPSALPIGPEAFNAANWSVAQGFATADNVDLTVNSLSRTSVQSYLENAQVPDYATLIANAAQYADGDVVYISDSGIAGTGTVVESVAHGYTSTKGYIVALTVDKYWRRDFDGVAVSSWWELLGDNSTDNAAEISQINDFITDIEPSIFIFNTQGVIRTSQWFGLVGCKHVKVMGAGDVDIRQIESGTDLTFFVGDRDLSSTGNTLESQSQALTANVTIGGSAMTVTDASAYSVGDWVLAFAGTSVSSSGTNRIPTVKQWFRIRTIVGNTLNFIQQSSFAFNISDDARVFNADKKFAIDCSVENMTFSNTDTHTGPYGHFICGAFGITLRNVNLDFYSAIGPTTFVDRYVFDNVDAVGFNGFSLARGTKRAAYTHCTYKPRFGSAQGQSTFFEECVESVLMDDCDLNGTVVLTAMADNPGFTEGMKLRNCKILSDDIAIGAKGYTNGNGYTLDVDRCIIDCPGDVGAAATKTIIDMNSFDSYRVTNTEFKNADADAYAVVGSNFGPVRGSTYGNRYNNSLGLEPSIERYFNVSDIDRSGDIGEEGNSCGTAHISQMCIPRDNTPLTVTSNTITVTGSNHTVDTSTAPQTVNTINGFKDGAILILSSSSSSNALTIGDGSGNIQTPGVLTLNNANDLLTLIYRGATWQAISFENNA